MPQVENKEARSHLLTLAVGGPPAPCRGFASDTETDLAAQGPLETLAHRVGRPEAAGNAEECGPATERGPRKAVARGAKGGPSAGDVSVLTN